MTDAKIDEVCYVQGRHSFDSGASIRSVVEAMKSADELDDPRTFSLALGFIDAAFDRLRGIQRRV